MKSMVLFALALALADLVATNPTDYFFRFVGGNPTIHGENLRLNNSFPYFDVGVTEPPRSTYDHFSRLRIYPGNSSLLFIVPTHPHPPPIPGYYALSGADNVEGAERLVRTYNPTDTGEASPYRYTEWETRQSSDGMKLLRYNNEDGAGRWIARMEEDDEGVKRWVAWWVTPMESNMDHLTSWDYDVVELELVIAGSANS